MTEPIIGASQICTLQLRTYQLTAETVEPFMDWWTAELLPVRRAYGFEVPVAYLVPDTTELIWVVAHPGDQLAFCMAEKNYNQTPERLAVMARQPHQPISASVHFILTIPGAGTP